MNRFLYAEGNPWSMVDPSGHASSYEGGGCGPGGKYCGSTGNDQNFHKNIKTVVAKAHNDYVHHPKARMYDPESTPTVSSEWATGDTWGENTSIGRASATETASQAVATHCTATRGGQSCQSAQQQADSAATMGGIGDAFGDIWNGVLHLGSCAGNILNCADVGLGLGMMAINPIGTGQAIGTQRAAAIASGDKRAGAHAITSTVIDFASILPMFSAFRAASVADAAFTTEASDAVSDVAATTRYARPPGATTGAQRASVQGQRCVICGQTGPRMIADHIKALVVQHLTGGGIDLEEMRSVDAVQPMCPKCSATEGGYLSQWSKIVHDLLGL